MSRTPKATVKTAPKTRQKERVASHTSSVDIDNTAYVAEICGPHDRHLALIEQDIDVYVMARGNRLDIKGGARESEMAAAVFRDLIERLDRGLHVEEADVSAAIRMVVNGPESGELLTTASDKHLLVTPKRKITARSPQQANYIDAIRDHDLVFGIGPAGTGKTYLAVVMGALMLLRGEVRRLILSRPAVEAGERLGFLPGDMKEKIDPYLRPLYDALYDVMPGDQMNRRMESGEIEVAPLAFMRGRTLSDAFVILDEAQNTTPVQMKMFLTRLGENAKMVITGDPTQVDLPQIGREKPKSGLKEALTVLRAVDSISTIHFSQKDVVRHPLVAQIVEAYDTHTAPTPDDRS